MVLYLPIILVHIYLEGGNLELTWVAIWIATFCPLCMATSGMFRTAILYWLGHKELVWRGQDESLVKFKMAVWFVPGIMLFIVVKELSTALLADELSLKSAPLWPCIAVICLALIGNLNAYAIWAGFGKNGKF